VSVKEGFNFDTESVEITKRENFMNEVRLFGYTGKDCVIRQTAGGNTVCQFSIGTDESYYDKKKGERVKKTEWHNCVQFGKGAETTAKYVTKGSQILVFGKLQTTSWDDRDGNKKYKTEVVVNRIEFGKLKDREAGQQGKPYPQAASRANNQHREPGQDDEPYPSDDAW
jgi:single-strand DNA-binding protein